MNPFSLTQNGAAHAVQPPPEASEESSNLAPAQPADPGDGHSILAETNDAGSVHLRCILDSIFGFVGLFSTEGTILEVNRAPLEVAGLERSDVVGRPFWETYWWSHSTKLQSRVRDAISRAAKGETVREDMEARLAGGRIVVVDITFGPIQNAGGEIHQVIAFGVDISDRKKAEAARAESEHRFQQVVESIREVFWMTDSEKREMLYLSPGFEIIWRRPCALLTASPRAWLDSVHPADRDRVEHAANTRQITGEYDEEYRIIRPDGSERWIRDRAFPVHNQYGIVYRIAGVAEDITQHKRLEAEVLQLQKMEAIGQLAAGVAHDFNNILTIIQGNASLLLADELDQTRKSLASEVAEAAERAASLTRQLLLFSRKQEMDPTPLNLNEVVGSMTKMLRRIVGEDISFETDFSPEIPLIQGDAGMVGQILLNLAVNARDAMPKGGRLLVSTQAEKVTVNQARQNPEVTAGRCVCIKVTDSGHGIPASALPHIFEPFFTTKEQGKGTGLGLATVYGIVKQHRGWVTVQSELERETTFRVYLPAIEGGPAPWSLAAAVAQLPKGNEIILLVEDEPPVRAVVDCLLQRCGYTVHAAANGPEALEIWSQQQDRISLLLTDLILPGGINGRELAERLQALKPALHVLFTSGYPASVVGQDLALTDGVNFLRKPYLPTKLAQTVRDSLDRK